MGEYYLTITKQEYDYVTQELSGEKVSLDILDGAWIVVSRPRYPYREVMHELYDLKTAWKKKDRLTSNNYKIVMNGFYGKMAQCIESEDGFIAGQGWNPLYSSVITANTRIAVTRLQNLLKKDCLAVHTDSIISKRPVPGRFLGIKLGEFEKVVEGDGVIVACGIYEIAGQQAFKGFKKHAITRVLREHPDAYRIEFTQTHVESWLQAAAQGHDESRINLFTNIPKVLKLNCDTKRTWPCDVTSTELLNNLQYSMPLIEQQNNEPEYWSKKSP
jgi:hypothetical protein